MLTLMPEIKGHLKKSPATFDDFMALQGACLRSMNGRMTKRILLGEKRYYIKQYYGVGFSEIIKNLSQFKLPIVSARNEWQALNRLKEAGMWVPSVVAYGEKGWNPATRQSFVMLEAIEPSISLETLTKTWHTQKPLFALKKTLIHAVADITANMHQLGMNHRDLYICHFLLKTQNSSQSSPLPLYLIDLHRAQIRDSVPMRWRIKDLAALYYSSLHIGLTKRDLFRFMKRYSKHSLRDTLKNDIAMWRNTYHRGEKLNRDHQ